MSQFSKTNYNKTASRSKLAHTSRYTSGRLRKTDNSKLSSAFNSRRHRLRFNAQGFVRGSFSIAQIVFVFMLIVVVFRFLVKSQTGQGFVYIDLDSLLTYLSNAPSIPTTWINKFDTSFASQFIPAFQWFGKFVDSLASFFGGLFFASTALSNAVIFILYFLRWIFL